MQPSTRLQPCSPVSMHPPHPRSAPPRMQPSTRLQEKLLPRSRHRVAAAVLRHNVKHTGQRSARGHRAQLPGGGAAHADHLRRGRGRERRVRGHASRGGACGHRAQLPGGGAADLRQRGDARQRAARRRGCMRQQCNKQGADFLLPCPPLAAPVRLTIPSLPPCTAPHLV